MQATTTFQNRIGIAKTAEDRRLVFGLASVSEFGGETVVDHENDAIPIPVLEKAAYNFVLYARRAGELHERTTGIGRLIESVVATEDKPQVQIWIDGKRVYGWWVGFKIDDADVWAKIKSGEYSAFSIGGKAVRQIDEAAA